jgi:hypothetical protein
MPAAYFRAVRIESKTSVYELSIYALNAVTKLKSMLRYWYLGQASKTNYRVVVIYLTTLFQHLRLYSVDF